MKINKTIPVSIFKILMPLFVLFFVQTVSHAQTVDLTGDWEGYEANGTKSAYVWRISQSGGTLSFRDVGAGTNIIFSGQLSGIVIADSNKKTGIVSNDRLEIKWSDGVIWRKKVVAASTGRGPRQSYDANLFRYDSTRTDPWIWQGAAERTIYNPLDGGILLKYTTPTPSPSDGCSIPITGGVPDKLKRFYQDACVAHDTNYDAPFPLAGFPSYPGGGTTGQDIADYIFYKDLQGINSTMGDGNGSDFELTAQLMYKAVQVGGQFRGKSTGRTILQKGGVVAVLNNGGYTVSLKVSWTAGDGTRRTAENRVVVVGMSAVVPLSIDAKDIEIECRADGQSNPIFTKSYSGPGMYSFTVGGLIGTTSVENGLTKNDARNALDPNNDYKVKYGFFIKTIDEVGSGTDSDIFIKICGDLGCTAEQQVNSKITGNAFERNEVNNFSFWDFVDVGRIAFIELRSDNSGAGSDWKPEWITISKENTSVFHVKRWINEKNPQKLFVDEVRTSTGDYEFAVKTFDESGAGTDSNIYFKICGSKGCTVEQEVNSKIVGNAFERNKVDTFTISGTDVGQISYIEIRSDTAYAGSDWKVEWITIGKDGKTSVFHVKRWFSDTSTVRLNVDEVR